MTKVILFLFIFTNICFAKNECKSLGKNIQHLNDLQSEALNNQDIVDRIEDYANSLSFIDMMKKSTDEENLTTKLSQFSLDSLSYDEEIKMLSLLHNTCELADKIQDKDLKPKMFKSCLANVKSLIRNKKDLIKKENKLKSDTKGLNQIIEQSFKDPKVINLGIVKKSLAQKFLDLKCAEESSNKELSESQAFNYACRDIVHRPHTEGIEDFSKDNLDILLELELQNNKVTDADFKKSCASLLKNPELSEELSFCNVTKVGDSPVDPPTKVGDDPVDPPTKVGDSPVDPPTKVGDDPVDPPTKVGDSPVDPPNPQKHIVDKTKGEFKKSKDRDPASKKVVKKKVDEDSYKAKRARKRKKTWKTIGIVTAAVGATGLAVWGLSELFKPTPSTLEFTPHPNSLKQYNTQSYDMNAYQQYMMYQNYQSNQSMMYQNNLYQGSTYGYGNNWIGAQDSSASSPYTFEYGF